MCSLYAITNFTLAIERAIIQILIISFYQFYRSFPARKKFASAFCTLPSGEKRDPSTDSTLYFSPEVKSKIDIFQELSLEIHFLPFCEGFYILNIMFLPQKWCQSDLCYQNCFKPFQEQSTVVLTCLFSGIYKISNGIIPKGHSLLWTKDLGSLSQQLPITHRTQKQKGCTSPQRLASNCLHQQEMQLSLHNSWLLQRKYLLPSRRNELQGGPGTRRPPEGLDAGSVEHSQDESF